MLIQLKPVMMSTVSEASHNAADPVTKINILFAHPTNPKFINLSAHQPIQH
jgi:hypothetical protein